MQSVGASYRPVFAGLLSANHFYVMSPEQSPKTIWPPYQAFYIHSMLFNTESARSSIEAVNSVMHVVFENSPENPLAAIPVHHVLDHLQNVTLQAAALSRYFWPVRNAHEWRGTQLRAVFEVSDQSPLKSRDLRNAIEHFDEKLDKYLEEGIVGQIFPEYVGPFPESDGVPVHLFRAYYIDKGLFELLGHRYEMNPIAAEVIRIHAELKRMAKSGNTFRRAEA